MERVVIFGSTGMTGICTVEAAVNKGTYNKTENLQNILHLFLLFSP